MEPLKEGIARAAHPRWENMTGPTHIGDVARRGAAVPRSPPESSVFNTTVKSEIALPQEQSDKYQDLAGARAPRAAVCDLAGAF